MKRLILAVALAVASLSPIAAKTMVKPQSRSCLDYLPGYSFASDRLTRAWAAWERQLTSFDRARAEHLGGRLSDARFKEARIAFIDAGSSVTEALQLVVDALQVAKRSSCEARAIVEEQDLRAHFDKQVQKQNRLYNAAIDNLL